MWYSCMRLCIFCKYFQDTHYKKRRELKRYVRFLIYNVGNGTETTNKSYTFFRDNFSAAVVVVALWLTNKIPAFGNLLRFYRCLYKFTNINSFWPSNFSMKLKTNPEQTDNGNSKRKFSTQNCEINSEKYVFFFFLYSKFNIERRKWEKRQKYIFFNIRRHVMILFSFAM